MNFSKRLAFVPDQTGPAAGAAQAQRTLALVFSTKAATASHVPVAWKVRDLN